MFWIAFVTALGLELRLYAAPRLPITADEKVYFQAALQYANFIRQGDWKMLSWYDYNYQHPPLYKIVYGVALLTRPPLDGFWEKDFTDGMAMGKVNDRRWGLTDRHVSVILGGLTVLALAMANPIAGLLYAIDTLAVQYNTYILLEALPALTSFLSVFCYLHWSQHNKIQSPGKEKNFLWLVLSAGFLGISVASKYTYAITVIAILLYFVGGIILNKNRRGDVWKLVMWGAIALAVFYVCDPFIWKHPISRLLDSLSYHLSYSQSDIVQEAHNPFYKPLTWFSAPVTTFSGFLKSSSSFLIELDTLIGLLALVGLPRLFTRQRLYFIWLVTGLLALMVWATKWPQYSMNIIIPVCMSAAMGAGWVLDQFKIVWAHWKQANFH